MQKGKNHRISFTADLKKDINMENVLIAWGTKKHKSAQVWRRIGILTSADILVNAVVE